MSDLSQLDRRLRLAIHGSLLMLIFFLPLLMWTRSSEVFELPKMLFVYAMTVVIVSLWLMRMVIQRRVLITRTPLDVPILLFLLSQVASTIYSIDPHTSWWGYYGRFHGGLWSTISYTLLYYAWVSNLFPEFVKRKAESGERFTFNVLRFTKCSVLTSAAVVSLYAIFQHFGIDKNFWVQDVVNRVFSTQGQPNWLAAYLVMVMPLGWSAVLRTKDEGRRTKDRARNFLSAFGLVLFFAFLFTKSRSGLLGLAVADIVFLLLLSIGHKILSLQIHWKNVVIAHALIFFLLVTVSNPARDITSSFLREPASPAVTNNEIQPRKSEHGGTESGDIRRVVWTGTLELLKRYPLLGTGPETFAYSYWRVRPKEHNLTSEWNFLYNKAHNEWLNLAANTGLFGLASHLLLLGWFIAWSLRTLRSPLYALHFTNIAIISALLGVEVVNFFGFSTVTIGAYRYLFMALSLSPYIKTSKYYTASGRVGYNNLLIIGIIFTIGIWLISQVGIRFLADLSYNRGQQYADAGYIEEAIEPATAAVKMLPTEPVFRTELAEAQGILAISLITSNDQDRSALVANLKDLALSNFRLAQRLSPANLSILKSRARVTFALGAADPKLYDEGIALMEQAAALAPTDPKILYNLGVMLDASDNKEKANELYMQSIILKPDFQEAKERLVDKAEN